MKAIIYRKVFNKAYYLCIPTYSYHHSYRGDSPPIRYESGTRAIEPNNESLEVGKVRHEIVFSHLEKSFEMETSRELTMEDNVFFENLPHSIVHISINEYGQQCITINFDIEEDNEESKAEAEKQLALRAEILKTRVQPVLEESTMLDIEYKGSYVEDNRSWWKKLWSPK